MQKLLLLFMILAFSGVLLAQPQLRPLHSSAFSARTAAHHGKAAFPFYDDFSNAYGMADTSRWQQGGGVFVNDAFGKNAPTKGVATFDGLNALGVPYKFGVPSAIGFADTLTSLPIDLQEEGLKAGDSVVLSFQWQARGWGEQPNKNDSLYLFFLNSSGNWVRQWAVGGIDTLTPFIRQDVTLRSTAFFHADFQFRFVNFARLSGAYDTWNIDYVYMNTRANARRPDAGIVRDLGFIGGKYELLKGYTHIPLSQYRDNLLQDTLKAPLRNALGSLAGDNVTHLVRTRVYANQLLAMEETRPASSVNSFGAVSSNGSITIPFNEVVEATANSLPIAAFIEDADSAILEHAFFLANNAEDLNGVFTKANDTVSQMLHLNNTFAYDDGTAEFGWGVNKKFARFAYQFEAFSNWEINAIDVHIAKVGNQLTQGGFRVGIWQTADTLDASNDVVLMQPVYFPIAYAEGLNQMQRLSLGKEVNIPAGKFFIVFEQLTDAFLPIGFDVHHQAADKIFVNLGGFRWQPLGNNFSGSLLLRPVYERQEVTALPEILQAPLLYPNPAQEEIAWPLPLEEISIYSLTGQQVLHTQVLGQSRLSVAHLPAGLYLAHLHSKQGVKVEKLMIK